MEGVEARNCQRCGRLFLSGGPSLCPSCLEAEEEAFERVRLYLIEHPGANLEQVSKGTGVPREAVLRYVQQGRLQAGSREEAGGRAAREQPDPSRVYIIDLFKDPDAD